jgi:hypothetical protein
MLDVILLDLPRSSLWVVLHYAEGAVRGMELVDLGLETGECGVSVLIEQGWPALVLSGFTDIFIEIYHYWRGNALEGWWMDEKPGEASQLTACGPFHSPHALRLTYLSRLGHLDNSNCAAGASSNRGPRFATPSAFDCGRPVCPVSCPLLASRREMGIQGKVPHRREEGMPIGKELPLAELPEAPYNIHPATCPSLSSTAADLRHNAA